MRTPPVQEDEILYRQIGPGGNPIYYDPNRAQPVDKSLFLPSPKDCDGLSLIRSRFRAERWAAYRVEQPQQQFKLVKLNSNVLIEVANEVGFGLTFEATSDALDEKHGPPFAHCVAREINRTDYDSDRTKKKLIKEWARKVSDRLGQGDILGPYPPPADEDPYRP